MSRRSFAIPEHIRDYIFDVSLREPDILAELRRETANLPGAGMQIGPDQGQFMALLIELIGARRCLEVGTFTGYSALAVALALPPDGLLVTCDINEETTAIARNYWQRAGVTDRIDLRLGPAVETLDRMIAVGLAESFDFAFIDADKENYEVYYERCLELLRPGGAMLIDNVLWSGAAADPRRTDPLTAAIKAFNRKVHADQRVSLSMLPVGDGITICRKRE